MGQLRIIGGRFRSLRLNFKSPKVRPTLDRVRETLFNWLQPFIVNADCLDLFAGSGALSFEAYSRGAGRLQLLELDRIAYQDLLTNAQRLAVAAFDIVHQDALTWLKRTKQLKASDLAPQIIFIDPPFQDKIILLQEILPIVLHLWPQAWVYLEVDQALEALLPVLPALAQYEICKQSRAGRVFFYLLKAKN